MRRVAGVRVDHLVRGEECILAEGVRIGAIKEGNEVVVPLRDRIIGRSAAEDIKAPRARTAIVEADQEIDEEAADRIEQSAVESVLVRSVLTCKGPPGCRAKGYRS